MAALPTEVALIGPTDPFLSEPAGDAPKLNRVPCCGESYLTGCCVGEGICPNVNGGGGAWLTSCPAGGLVDSTGCIPAPPAPVCLLACGFAEITNDPPAVLAGAAAGAAAGLLAMVYFQMNNYVQAEQYASLVINSGTYAMSDTLDRFPATPEMNPETVFGIVSSNPGADHVDQRTDNFIGNYNAGGVLPPNLMLSNELYQFTNLNSADDRLMWMQSSSGKYKNRRFENKVFFNIPIIYLTELRLIRAECLGEMGGDLSVAIADINAIRDRAFGAGLNDLSASSTASQVIAAARREYRIETMGEGKWINQLKRIGAKGESVYVRNAPWNCPGMALQFPNSEFTSALFVGNPEGGCN